MKAILQPHRIVMLALAAGVLHLILSRLAAVVFNQIERWARRGHCPLAGGVM